MLDPFLFEEGRLEILQSFDGISRSEGDGGIGTMGEKSVHRVLKYCCSPFSDGREVTIGGYVADVDMDGNPVYALRYSEFIPLIVEQVQKVKIRVKKLEESYGTKRNDCLA